LDVLAEDRVDSRLAAVDCEASAIVLPLGAQATVDLAGLLTSRTRIESVRALSVGEGPPLGVSVMGRAVVALSSQVDFSVASGEDEYRLAVSLQGPEGQRVLSCPLVVQRQPVPATFYARATPQASEGQAAAEATVEPTPTESPWPSSPSYTVPAPAGAGVQKPAYSSPGSGDVTVQSPSYQGPGQDAPGGTP